MNYFLDTSPLIEIANGNPDFEKYLDEDCITLKDNLAELFYFLLIKYDSKTAHYFLKKFSYLANDLPLDIISKAMEFRYTHKTSKFSYIDCLGYAFSF